MEIVTNIRNLREDKDWTQKHIAQLLKINRRTYSAYENGVNQVPNEILIRLADIYDVSVDYLLGLTSEKTRPTKINQD